MIDDLLNAALKNTGTAKALAAELDISQSELTKFHKGDAGFKIHHLRKLFELSGLALTSETEKQDLISAALTFARLYEGKR